MSGIRTQTISPSDNHVALRLCMSRSDETWNMYHFKASDLQGSMTHPLNSQLQQKR
jgi:hypothetical protein